MIWLLSIILPALCAASLSMNQTLWDSLDWQNGEAVVYEDYNFNPRAGRREDTFIWSNFSRVKRKVYYEDDDAGLLQVPVISIVGRCPDCNAERASNASRLNHITNCANKSASTKKTASDMKAAKSKARVQKEKAKARKHSELETQESENASRHKRQRRESNTNTNATEDEDDDLKLNDINNATVGVNSNSNSNSTQNASNTTLPRYQGYLPFSGAFVSEADKLLSRFLYTDAQSFNVVENEKLREFVKFVSLGRYELPSRASVGGVMLDRYYEETKERVHKVIATPAHGPWHINYDGGSDRCKAKHLVALSNPKPLVFSVSGPSHIGRYSAIDHSNEIQSYIDAAKDISDAVSIKTLMTDNENTMRAARKDVEEKVPEVTSAGCADHSLNKLLGDLMAYRVGTLKKLDLVQSAIKNTKIREKLESDLLPADSSFVFDHILCV